MTTLALFGSPALSAGDPGTSGAEDPMPPGGVVPSGRPEQRMAADLLRRVHGDDGGDGRSALLVGPRWQETVLRRIARFVTAASGRCGVDVVCVDGSPFLASAVVEAAALHDLDGRPRDESLSALVAIARQARSLVVAPSGTRLRRPRVTLRRRLQRLGRDEILVGRDGTGLWRVPVTAEPPPALVRGLDRDGTLALVADGPTGRPLEPLLGRVCDRTVRRVATRTEWTAWWGEPRASEIALVPDRDSVLVAADHLRSGAWRCYWCQALQFAPGACPRCGADDRRPVPSRHGRPAVARP